MARKHEFVAPKPIQADEGQVGVMLKNTFDGLKLKLKPIFKSKIEFANKVMLFFVLVILVIIVFIAIFQPLL